MVLEVIKLNVEDDNDNEKNTSDSTCQICNQQFKHLRSHIWKVHGERSWDCDYCDKSFKLAAHLKIHLTNVHEISDGLPCNFCHKTFLIRKCLEDHKAKSHGIQDRQRCKNCSQIFENSKDFKHHLVSVHGLTVYSCDLCQKFFKQKGNLRTHIDKVHEVHKNFVCHVTGCGKSYNDSGGLKVHLLQIHGIGKTFKCQICKENDVKIFEKAEDMKKHYTKKHNAKIFSCNRCSKFYRDKYILKEHVKTTHEGGKRQNCEICGRSCVSKQVLEKHMNAVHGFNEDVTNVQCHKCDNSFARVDQLKKHVSAEHHKTFFHFLSERKKNEKYIIKFEDGENKLEKMNRISQLQNDRYFQKSAQIDQLKKHVKLANHHEIVNVISTERKIAEETTSHNFERNRELLKSEMEEEFLQFQHDHFQTTTPPNDKKENKEAHHLKIISSEKLINTCGFCKAVFETKKDLDFHILAFHRKINLQPRIILKRLNPKIISEFLIKYEEDDKIIKAKHKNHVSHVDDKFTEIQQYQYDHLLFLPQQPTPGLFPSAPQGLLISPPQTPNHITTPDSIPEIIHQSQDVHDSQLQPQKVDDADTEVVDLEQQQTFECDFCQKLFKRESNFRLHIMSFHDFDIFPCTSCGWPFETEVGLKRHLGAFHQEDSLLLPPKISMEDDFLTDDVPEEIQQYQNDHSQMPQTIMEYQCEVCYALFTKKSALKLHFTEFHYFEIFPCEICHWPFETESGLKRHLGAFHLEYQNIKKDEFFSYLQLQYNGA